ncbi:NAD(P)(+) transhydrogenase [Mycoavidus cysteinexigens]|uniref:NAD(P) transhydrogenase subunit alpha part 1 n=1 Tax=Mycoavidus cysteinexigens TaxID=1553431 RepID=A0A2Z6EXG9_9BURK|nr:Re/Si-specific NAD(P)(+) transhydrogenase subunit alpha [Mycoavidus cysteinexigens]BBE10154.1 NAD(P)(+) transhydrogenase [Mycoavidus cysteinexigens]GAM53493.1 NAD(P) transhydrogenase alpha subunit [bacterium endosymbiont of Mortierella elongata FMR23-6]GLR00571.1 NAD(P) transhydrogenase subunit alpha [Mycoavidus cysteinexigens]
MHIGIPLETYPGETRIAATPETVSKLVAQGHRVTVQKDAGARAWFSDQAFLMAGAEIGDVHTAFAADLVLKVRAPNPTELALSKPGSVLVGMLNPLDTEQARLFAQAGLTAFALEAAPRTTRAQSLDVLSSQANIAGYRAALLAASLYPRFLPMLMTAAGSVKAARVLVLGAGVAGLQAIATAKRLGAVVEASDARPAVQEQIESLGAKFISVPYATDDERAAGEGSGGYARPMPASWLQRQATQVRERIRQSDIIIATALIPGHPAPILISEETVKTMQPGSVIVDLAAGHGALSNPSAGNCALTETDKVVTRYGVQIAGYTNLPALAATDASTLYARNILAFLKLIIDSSGALAINLQDEIVAATLLCRAGQQLKPAHKP